MKYESSLHGKPHFEELINYIEAKQPTIKYPDRAATFLRRSPYLTQFDGDSWIDLDDQENKIRMERMRTDELRRVAGRVGGTAREIEATNPSSQPPPPPPAPAAVIKKILHENGTQTSINSRGVSTQSDTPDTKMKGQATQSDAKMTQVQTSRGVQVFSISDDNYEQERGKAYTKVAHDIEQRPYDILEKQQAQIHLLKKGQDIALSAIGNLELFSDK